jgi:PTS system nitrogen regulatory IIA component
MKIEDLIAPERVIVDLRPTDKGQLLSELARRMAAAVGLGPEKVLQALQAREELGSTGIGAGLAMPHARIDGATKFVGLFARLGRAIDFNAVDEEPVDLVFALLSPERASNEHLQALACVSRRLREPGIAARLRAASDAQAIYRLLTGSNR